MQEEQILEALNKHSQAAAAGDLNAEHDIYKDDAICDYPQSGERIPRAKRFAGLAESSGKPAGSRSGEFSGKVIPGSPNTQSPARGPAEPTGSADPVRPIHSHL
jgi:hypothetical protein